MSKRYMPVEDLDEFTQFIRRSAMKKQTADGKRAAANDKPETEAKKAKAPKSTKAEKPVER